MTARTRKALFLAATLSVPLVLLLALEGALRVLWNGGWYPLFVRAPLAGEYLVANPRVGRRWFAQEQHPPGPLPDVFAAAKPPRGFRVFVLGESSTAGFPYPRNATFSRLLRDVLRDALSGDSVEVVNLGIAATNSYAMLDLAGEILAQRPDAVLIYAGHNEWYGALGAASTEALLSQRLVRLTLTLQRWRTFMALRHAITWARAKARGSSPPLETASLMETLARDREIPLGGPTYLRGVRQYGENLELLVERFRGANVPVFVGSLASNVRDQPPLASPANGRVGGADGAYADAARMLASGDTSGARTQFYRARDLDVVRFRAPSAFDSVARAVAGRHGAVYVPVAERFAAATPSGIPGRELFLEHVHPNADGYALLARVYFDAMQAAGVPGNLSRGQRPDWAAYTNGRWLTRFDLAIAEHTRQTLLHRWPFVPSGEQRDYRATYVPRELVDSMAFLVSRGQPWEIAKLRVAQRYEERRQVDSAIVEYRGLVRDAPLFAPPHRMLGRALLVAGRVEEAEAPLRRALAIEPDGAVAQSLARIALRRRSIKEGINLLELSLRLEPDRPDAMYQLALARAADQDITGARAAATRLARVAPNYPGLPALMRSLGGQLNAP